MGVFIGGLFRLPLLKSAFLFPATTATATATATHKSSLHLKHVRTGNFVLDLMGVATVLCLGYCVVFSAPYSAAARPKRLWVHHVQRDLTGLGGGTDSGLWLVGFDGSGLDALKPPPYSLQDTGSAWLHDSNYQNLRGGEGERRRDWRVAPNGRGFNCDINSGECYIYWPYFFPVAEALLDSLYIPDDGRNRNHGEREEVEGGSARDGERGRDKEASLFDESDKRFTVTSSETKDVPLETLKSFGVNADSVTAAAAPVRRVSIVVTGPSHLTLVIKDND